MSGPDSGIANRRDRGLPRACRTVAMLLAACGGGEPGGTSPFGEGGAESEAESEAAGACQQGTVRECETVCGRGMQACDGRGWTPCDAEACDAIDNDCDGLTDETCECEEGRSRPCGDDLACAPGVQRCRDGAWGPCEGGDAGGEETCDGRDNDCNGLVDEGCECSPDEEQGCGVDEGACRRGRQACEDGAWGPCRDAVAPSPETCNGADDDCDGETDELWNEDPLEDNDSEDAATVLPEVRENGDPFAVSASVFPPGDQDWYLLPLVESTEACIPFTSEPDYRLSLRLALPEDAGPSDFRFCATGRDMALCAGAREYLPDEHALLLVACWDGRCGADDAPDFTVSVQAAAAAASACGDYVLRAEFVQPGDGCP